MVVTLPSVARMPNPSGAPLESQPLATSIVSVSYCSFWLSEIA